jgi:hypothetical protein
MGQVIIAYTDGKRHKHDCFNNRAERDATVKELRRDGWMVDVSKTVIEGADWYFYEATKER